MGPNDRSNDRPNDLAGRARRAYELGRLRWAARVAFAVVPLSAVSAACCGRPATSLAVGALLLCAAVGLRFRGQAFGAAVLPGLCAGLAPLFLLLCLKMGAMHLCSLGACMVYCVQFCFSGGFVAGLLLSLRARRLRGDALPFLLSGGVVAGLTGLLGCFVGGAAGALGMLVGEALAAMPIALQARRGL